MLLFYNDQHFPQVVELMKIEQGTASPNSNLLYHLNLLRLLTICTEGKMLILFCKYFNINNKFTC